jgi:2-polyprenyl-3-methyl-5-hydroxy-6-metoxy-1,4-benzoquinol methylase
MGKESVKYSRQNPSARYRRLVELYRDMHVRGELIRGIAPENTFPGSSLAPQAHHIRRLVAQTESRSILDYGCGKGTQYRPMALAGNGSERWQSMQEYWNVERIECYDAAYLPFSRLPSGRFDGVISTDVLEQCPEDDLAWIVDELFSFAGRFVFASIACHPAMKRLPNGENAHCTVRAPEYWQALFEAAAARRPELLWEVRAYTKGQEADVRLGNTRSAELAPVARA